MNGKVLADRSYCPVFICIIFSNWKNEFVFDVAITNYVTKFWSGVQIFQNNVGQQPFLELANFALTFLTNPVSNAAVERVFSQVAAVIIKTRNIMG